MTSDDRPEMTTREALQAVCDRGKFVWVVFGVYGDRSGSKLLGIYTDMRAAEDRVKLLKSAESAYSVNFAKMPLDQASGVRLDP